MVGIIVLVRQYATNALAILVHVSFRLLCSCATFCFFHFRIFFFSKIPRIGKVGYGSLLPTLIKEEGFMSLWKGLRFRFSVGRNGIMRFWLAGNSAAVIRVVPYMSVTFLSYEKYQVSECRFFRKNFIQNRSNCFKVILCDMSSNKSLVHLTSGSLAGKRKRTNF